jgi:deferrochelatase/peroxidase EfeB
VPVTFKFVRRVPVHQRGPGWTYRPDDTPPTLYGPHPPGIVSPHLIHGVLGAFDEVRPDWPELAEALMREGGMTVTLGYGPPYFPRDAPTRLKPLPAFPGDQLDETRCGGAACVLICSDEPTDALERFGTPRWSRAGRRTAQGALGFRDGTLNLRRPKDFDRHVWVTGGDRSFMLGGTYLVVRDIEVLDSWRRLDEAEQEQAIGRHRRSGAPLSGRRLYDAPILEHLPPDSHIRLAAPRSNHGAAMLRRGYDTDDGLLFLAFMQDPRRQFVPVQRRLAEQDALRHHTRTRGSALFAVPRQPLLYRQ